MTTNNTSHGKSGGQANASQSSQKDTNATLADRASDLKDRAGGIIQDGIDYVKNNPGTTAAVIGGVAAAAAAIANKDKIVEAASGLRDKISSGKDADEQA